MKWQPVRLKSQSRILRHRRLSRAAIRSSIRRRRSVHKRLLLSPISTFILLCCGVILCGLTTKATANTIVSAVIEAPPLTTAATIMSPNHGTSTQNSTIQVRGTCPSDSYVTLRLNGVFNGVAWCDNHTYTIQASLYRGENEMAVQAYNVTDRAGPHTPAIRVTYDEPVISATPASIAAGRPRGGLTLGASPILLTSNFTFRSFSVAEDFSWQLDLEGGRPPYTVHVSWGDGSSAELYFKTDPVFTLNHHYANPGYFVVHVTSTDTVGQQKIMQLAALLKNANGDAPYLTALKTKKAVGPSTTAAIAGVNIATKRWLAVAWPTYIVVLLMATSFWLGELQEYRQALRTVGR